MRLIRKNSIINWLYGEAISYPTPTSLSFFWSFGVMALVCLVSQIISGIFLAMHYIPSAELAFSSVEHIMRDVRAGWFLWYLHANGASMFFLVVYLHVCRGLYYNSFGGKREFVWYSGIILLFVMIITAFLGYVLPWGQMSFWAATVITSLASAIPLVGDFIVTWLWGGFSVGEQTLVRFFSLHYLLPFILFALVAAHIVLLHETGSNTPTGISLNWGDWITFGPYFFLKDLYYLVLFFFLFVYFIFFNSNYLGHPDNYIPAMYMSTPAHIVPEWYFLPFYALLWSVPNKLGGVTVMLLSIIALAILPLLLNGSSKWFLLNSNFIQPRAIFFSFFVANSILLGWIGGQPIEEPMYTVGQYSSAVYFILIFIVFPLLNLFLAAELLLEKKFVWWEEFLFFLTGFIRPLISIIISITDFFASFRINLDKIEESQYYRGEHPDFEWPIDGTWDQTIVGFQKNVVEPRLEFMLDLTWEDTKKYCDNQNIRLTEMIEWYGATEKSEQLWCQQLLASKKKMYENMKKLLPEWAKQGFFYLFPPRKTSIKHIGNNDIVFYHTILPKTIASIVPTSIDTNTLDIRKYLDFVEEWAKYTETTLNKNWIEFTVEKNFIIDQNTKGHPLYRRYKD